MEQGDLFVCFCKPVSPFPHLLLIRGLSDLHKVHEAIYRFTPLKRAESPHQEQKTEFL